MIAHLQKLGFARWFTQSVEQYRFAIARHKDHGKHRSSVVTQNQLCVVGRVRSLVVQISLGQRFLQVAEPSPSVSMVEAAGSVDALTLAAVVALEPGVKG